MIRLNAGIEFVGAVHRQVEPVDLIQRGQRNFASLGVGAGGFRGRHADHAQPTGHLLAEQLDKMLRGRTGAEPELHAIAHMLQRTRRRLPLKSVHIHVLNASLKYADPRAHI